MGGIHYQYDANGNRTRRTVNGVTEYYGIHANLDRLEWVNQGTNAAPTSGQANPYTLFQYDANGRQIWRERKIGAATPLVQTFHWDSDDRVRQVKRGATSVFTALYDAGGLRINKSDLWTGNHDFSWGPGGVIHDSSGNTRYAPGLAQRKNDVDRFFHSDWLGSTRNLSDSTGAIFASALR